MNTLLSVDWWQLEDILVPFFAIVLAPATILIIVALMRKHRIDRKTEVMLAAIEKGIELDPSFYGKPRKSKKDSKEEKYQAGITSGIIGLALIIIGFFVNRNALLFVIPGAVLFAAGVGSVASIYLMKKERVEDKDE